eukprot:686429-Hanusia_phi.AAC.2
MEMMVWCRQDEVIAIGLNTAREICMRQPHAMDADLLQDLVAYKKHKDKGVVMAARSLLSLYRLLFFRDCREANK